MVKTLLASFLLFTGLAFSQSFPGAVVTNATIPFAVDHSTTTLSTTITSSSTTITVASSANFAAFEVVNIDAEQIQICSVSVNILNVCVAGRGYFGTTAAAHSGGANVYGYVNAGIINTQFLETQSIENWLRNTQPGILSGEFFSTSGGPLTGTLDANTITTNTANFAQSTDTYTPFGVFGNAAANAIIINNTGQHQSPQVMGIPFPYSQLATYSGRDSVAQYIETNNFAPLTLNSSTTYTATTMTNSSLIGLTTVKVGMIVDTLHATKYSGVITAFNSTTGVITTNAWYQTGNTSAGQIPPNSFGAIVNPNTADWLINGLSFLADNGQADTATMVELDFVDTRTRPALGSSTGLQIANIGTRLMNGPAFWANAATYGGPGFAFTEGFAAQNSQYSFLATPPYSIGFYASQDSTGHGVPFGLVASPGPTYPWMIDWQGNETVTSIYTPGNIIASAYTSTGALALNAGGTNQNVNLTPTGTGVVNIPTTSVTGGLADSSSGRVWLENVPAYLGGGAYFTVDTGSSQEAFRIAPSYNGGVPSLFIDIPTSGQSYGANPSSSTYVHAIGITAGGAISINNGTNALFRCTVAGTLRVGQTTTVSGDCGASVDTGLRVN